MELGFGRQGGMMPRASSRPLMRERPRLKIFAAGLAIRLAGAGLLWLGDGHNSVFRKGLVVTGVVLSVGGIGVLKFLLYQGPRKKPRPAVPPTP